MLLLILIISNLIASFISYWSSTFDLAHKDNEKFLKINAKGWIYIVLTVVLIILAIFQYKIANSIAEKEQNERDSIVEMHYNTSIRNLRLSMDTSNKLLAQELGKYNLKYDYAQKRIEKLVRDSSKIIYVQPEDPTLILGSLEKEALTYDEKSKKYRFTISSESATSTDISLVVSHIASNDYKNWQYLGGDLFLVSRTISKNRSMAYDLPRDTSLNYRYWIQWIRGSYKNGDKTKSFIFDEMLLFDHASMKPSFPASIFKDELIQVIKENEKGN